MGIRKRIFTVTNGVRNLLRPICTIDDAQQLKTEHRYNVLTPMAEKKRADFTNFLLAELGMGYWRWASC